MFQYIILAIVVVILISLVYYVFYHNGDVSKRKKSEKLLQRSAGVFDENARRAMDELTRINNPDADDYFRRGHIIQYNILEGNVRGRLGENTRARQQRRTAVGNIVRDYTDTLVGMRGHVGLVGEDRDLAPEFMVFHIEDFNRHLLDMNDDDIEMAQLVNMFNDTVTTHAPAVRQEIIEDRRNRAVAAANTRAEAINRYFDDATKFTNDRQSIHDSKVNSDLRDILKKLKSTAPKDFDPIESIEEAREFIVTEFSNDPNNARKINSINQVLETVRRGERISTFAESENNIFAYTWERCKHPRNRNNEKLMKEAVINALADSVENGTQVCINGRCGRVLNSLVTLDYDKGIAETGALTFEAYKNQIFQETKEIINQEIDRAKNSGDQTLKAVGDAYETGDTIADAAVETKFKNEVKQEIDRNLNTYAGKLSSEELEGIKQECYVYATL